MWSVGIRYLVAHSEDSPETIIRLLRTNQEQPETITCTNSTLLHFSVLSDRPAITLALIHEGVDVRVENHSGETALHWASGKGFHRCCNVLIFNGANIDHQDVDGNSPLHWACESGHMATINTLIQANCDINIVNNENQTPLEVAAVNGHIEVVKLLLQQGYDSIDLVKSTSAVKPLLSCV